MRILVIGATGHLGPRLIPALLAHGHEVSAYVRSIDKLRSIITPALFAKISADEGDALESSAVEAALRKHDCDALINCAGNRLIMDGSSQIRAHIAAAVSSAAIRVGKDRSGNPLRAWFIGALSSLEYPGTGGWKIEDYMPALISYHMRGTEVVLTAIPTAELAWSLLCVAFMTPALPGLVDVLDEPRRHSLAVKVRSPPEWRDSWLRCLPFVGVYLNLVPVIVGYSIKLEDAADFLAEDYDQGSESAFVGELVGMKEVVKSKTI